MVRHAFTMLIAAATLLVVCGLSPRQAAAQNRPTGSSDLFYNYYAPPGSEAGVTAAMYVSPRPAPPLVGHTYITYQPLLPQEFLYCHHYEYVTRHCDGGKTHTSVTYGHMPKLWPFQPSVMWGITTPHTPPAGAYCAH
jgi:hypothetical protein